MNDITWLDALLVLMVAVFVAVGAEKKLIGFFVGVGGVVALRVLQGVWQGNPALAIALGLNRADRTIRDDPKIVTGLPGTTGAIKASEVA